MFEFKSIICVKMAQRTSANLIRVLYNLSREHESHKRKSLLNAGLIEMIIRQMVFFGSSKNCSG